METITLTPVTATCAAAFLMTAAAAIGFFVGSRIGREEGYSDGWRDARAKEAHDER